MAIDQSEPEDKKDSKSDLRDSLNKKKTISKSEFLDIHNSGKCQSSILKAPPTEDKSKVETFVETPHPTTPELSILIMKNEVAQKIVSNFVEVPQMTHQANVEVSEHDQKDQQLQVRNVHQDRIEPQHLVHHHHQGF